MPARAIAVAPDTRAGMYEAMCRAVIDGGGTLADISVAEGLVWSDPARPEAFPSLVAEASRLEWIQLPYAGIEPLPTIWTNVGDGRAERASMPRRWPRPFWL